MSAFAPDNGSCSPHTTVLGVSEVASLTPTLVSDGRAESLTLEKGFWRVRHGAQELLRFSDIYKRSHDKYAVPSAEVLPEGIDLVAMTQLSWGILHAVGDIKTHQRRVEELDALWRKDIPLVARRPASLCKEPSNDFGCSRCSRIDSPRWRKGPDGPRSLCNVCGLVYAKRSRKLKADAKKRRSGSFGWNSLASLG